MFFFVSGLCGPQGDPGGPGFIGIPGQRGYKGDPGHPGELGEQGTGKSYHFISFDILFLALSHMCFICLGPANGSVRLMSNLHIVPSNFDSGWGHCDITQLPGCETVVGSIVANPNCNPTPPP